MEWTVRCNKRYNYSYCKPGFRLREISTNSERFSDSLSTLSSYLYEFCSMHSCNPYKDGIDYAALAKDVA